jgi:hypothetical protein
MERELSGHRRHYVMISSASAARPDFRSSPTKKTKNPTNKKTLRPKLFQFLNLIDIAVDI